MKLYHYLPKEEVKKIFREKLNLNFLQRTTPESNSAELCAEYFFLPPVLLLISLISSITSVIMKKNIIGIILIIVVVLAFIPLCYLQIFAILCGITGYHG